MVGILPLEESLKIVINCTGRIRVTSFTDHEIITAVNSDKHNFNFTLEHIRTSHK